MNPSAQVPPEKFVESMKDEIERYAKEVMEAVNKAPDGRGLLAAKNTFATFRLRCGAGFLGVPFSSGWMRRKPLFPPPHHPTTGERLRQVVEAVGRGVLRVQQDDAIAVTWHAEDCVIAEGKKRREDACLHGLRRRDGADHHRRREDQTPR